MKYSITTDNAIRLFGIEEGFAKIREAGFDACDFGEPMSGYTYGKGHHTLDDAAFDAHYARFARAAKAAGLFVGQLHAPFPTWPESHDEAEFRFMMNAIRRSLRAAAIMESPCLVIHCAMRCDWNPDDDPAATREMNRRVLEELLPEAEKNGVVIALENMPIRGIPTSTAEDLVGYVDMMDSPYLKACLDTGHANISEEDPADFVRALGKRLAALHIHDNYHRAGRPIASGSDTHTTPLQGVISWGPFFAALAEVGYQGTLSLESDTFTKNCDRENYVDFAAFECRNLKRLAEKGMK